MEHNDARDFYAKFVRQLGWRLVKYFPLMTPDVPTPHGRMRFDDGVMTFVNPKLFPAGTKQHVQRLLGLAADAGPGSLAATSVWRAGPYTAWPTRSAATDWTQQDRDDIARTLTQPW